VAEGEISVDVPRAADVRELLEHHLAFARSHSPPEDVHVLDIDGLLDPALRSSVSAAAASFSQSPRSGSWTGGMRS
jgi:hypothetical protein